MESEQYWWSKNSWHRHYWKLTIWNTILTSFLSLDTYRFFHSTWKGYKAAGAGNPNNNKTSEVAIYFTEALAIHQKELNSLNKFVIFEAFIKNQRYFDQIDHLVTLTINLTASYITMSMLYMISLLLLLLARDQC